MITTPRLVLRPWRQSDRPLFAEQNADHPEREVDFRGQVHDGRGPLAQVQDPPVLGPGPEVLGHPVAGRDHHVDQVEGRPAARQRPPLGQGVGPDHRPGLPVEPAVPVTVVASHSAAIS